MKLLWPETKNSVYSRDTSLILTSIVLTRSGVDLALRTDWRVRLPWILARARKYFRSFYMCIYHLRNVCDVWKEVSLFPSYLNDSLPASCPRVDLALRTDWCVWLPWINVGPRKYFRSFHLCIHQFWNVCHVRKKISLFPSYLADPYQHQPGPTVSHILASMRTVWCAWLPSLSADAPKYLRRFWRHM